MPSSRARVPLAAGFQGPAEAQCKTGAAGDGLKRDAEGMGIRVVFGARLRAQRRPLP